MILFIKTVNNGRRPQSRIGDCELSEESVTICIGRSI